MVALYVHTLCARARLAWLTVAEKGLDVTIEHADPWQPETDFLAINPAGDVPVFRAADGSTVCGLWAVLEYLEESISDLALIPGDAAQRAEVRRLTDWFARKFAVEVTDLLAGEKLVRRQLTGESPLSQAVRAGRRNIHTHLAYIDFLLERRDWLAGHGLSLADLAAGAHLSLVDYSGDVPWGEHPLARDWYARLKSRPSMRALLAERVPGIPPVDHYADPDF